MSISKFCSPESQVSSFEFRVFSIKFQVQSFEIGISNSEFDPLRFEHEVLSFECQVLGGNGLSVIICIHLCTSNPTSYTRWKQPGLASGSYKLPDMGKESACSCCIGALHTHCRNEQSSVTTASYFLPIKNTISAGCCRLYRNSAHPFLSSATLHLV